MEQYPIPYKDPHYFLAWIASQYIGSKIPYIYGGDDPLEGWDCNGFAHECLQAVGYEKRGFDDTAHGMYLGFAQNNHIIDKFHSGPGCIIFYFQNGRAIHVGVLITPSHMVHAGGGGRDNIDFQTAVDDNAYVRVDQIDYRPEEYKIADPYGTKVYHLSPEEEKWE